MTSRKVVTSPLYKRARLIASAVIWALIVAAIVMEAIPG